MTGDKVWFAYDGDCPICNTAAQALRIRKSVGELRLVDARENANHPLIREITEKGLDLDAGMVLMYQHTFYHGEDALHMMAMLGSPVGWFNRANALLFKSKFLARLCYPTMRAGRNLLLRVKSISKIANLRGANNSPVFRQVFGEDWDYLPPVMRVHYAVRPYSDDRVVVSGTLDVEVSPFMSVMSRLSGMLISRSGKNIPVTVTFRSGPDSPDFYFDRVFYFPQGTETFTSRMSPVGGNELVEYMRFGIGWKMAFHWTGEKIKLSHRGYVWRIFGWLIPIPLGLILGAGEAEETPLSDETFHMWTHTVHPWFGKGFAYAGTFKVTEVSCPEMS